MEPLHKERTSDHCGAEGRSSASGEVINDTAALHAADVGISVDSAVDAAKQSAIVLLDKSLTVIADGVRESNSQHPMLSGAFNPSMIVNPPATRKPWWKRLVESECRCP